MMSSLAPGPIRLIPLILETSPSGTSLKCFVFVCWHASALYLGPGFPAGLLAPFPSPSLPVVLVPLGRVAGVPPTC